MDIMFLETWIMMRGKSHYFPLSIKYMVLDITQILHFIVFVFIVKSIFCEYDCFNYLQYITKPGDTYLSGDTFPSLNAFCSIWVSHKFYALILQ